MTPIILPAKFGYQIISPYNRAFVDDLKNHVPAAARAWSQTEKSWQVADSYIETVRLLIQRHYGVALAIPERQAITPAQETRRLEIHYLGACKNRDGESFSFGFDIHTESWSAVFPESVLRDWFNSTETSEPRNYYHALTVAENADGQVIKSAYRRLARTWHPDVCQEENAVEMFRLIQQAYETLSDEALRRKYNAGLFLERSLRQPQLTRKNHSRKQNFYAPPLRCGLITCTGQPRLNRFYVERITDWQDIRNSDGAVMVSSWPPGREGFTINWMPF